MKRKSLAGLVVLNAALLLVLGITALTPQPAEAQLGGIRGGDYLMIAGSVPGRVDNTLYIVDLNSTKMLAVTYDQSRRSLFAVGARNMEADF